jgi:hypothetical protein
VRAPPPSWWTKTRVTGGIDVDGDSLRLAARASRAAKAFEPTRPPTRTMQDHAAARELSNIRALNSTVKILPLPAGVLLHPSVVRRTLHLPTRLAASSLANGSTSEPSPNSRSFRDCATKCSPPVATSWSEIEA